MFELWVALHSACLVKIFLHLCFIALSCKKRQEELLAEMHPNVNGKLLCQCQFSSNRENACIHTVMYTQ